MPFWKPSVQQEVEAEIAFHVEMRTRELIARGMSPDDARRAALARFGRISDVIHECRSIGELRERDMRRTEYLGELRHDVRFALRQLAAAPAFAIVAVLTLALGLGATTAIFSAVEAVVLRPFPYASPGRLVFAYTRWRSGDAAVSVGDYADWRQRSTSFDAMGAFQFRGATWRYGGTPTASPKKVTVAYTTASVFPLLGVRPEQGRVFTDAEDQPGRGDVVVVSDAFWRRALGTQPIAGRTLVVNGQRHTIIGVMPATFDPTDSHEDLWIPAAFTAEQLAYHDEHSLLVLGRLKTGITQRAAQREMDAIAARMAVEYPRTNKVSGVHLVNYATAVIGDYRTRLFVILGAVACVLLIACANVANLLLARGAARSKELAIRTAIGAGRGRILRQLLTESAVLSGLAAIGGIGLAWLTIHGLIGAAPAGIPRLAATTIDAPVLLFAVGLAAFSSLASGLIPALRSVRHDVQQTLREGGRTAVGSAREPVRLALIVAEVAIAFTLLAGGGLLIRSAIYLARVDPGFDPRAMVTARVTVRSTPDLPHDAEYAEQTFQRVVEALQARPGVEAAAVTSTLPFDASATTNGLVPEDREQTIANAINSRLHMVSPGYLKTMRIPLIAGRGINGGDVRGGLRVMVVSESFAKAAWPGQNPIGKRVTCCEGGPGDRRWKTIVGVAADVHAGGPTQTIAPDFYIPVSQAPIEAWRWVDRTMAVVVRAKAGDPTRLVPMLRDVVHSIDPTAPVYGVATATEGLARTVAESRFQLSLLVTLGVLGLLLAAAGLYSVVAYFVTLRTQEIGVRMALGATSRDVMRLLTWSGLRPVFAGITLGALAALGSTRLLRGSLYGVRADDPVTFAAVTAMLLGVSLAAILVPARRATSVDPTTVLPR